MKTNDTLGCLVLLGFGSLIYLSVSSCSDVAKHPTILVNPVPSQTVPVEETPATPPIPDAPRSDSPAPHGKEIYIEGTPIITVQETKMNLTISCTLCLKCHKQ